MLGHDDSDAFDAGDGERPHQCGTGALADVPGVDAGDCSIDQDLAGPGAGRGWSIGVETSEPLASVTVTAGLFMVLCWGWGWRRGPGAR